MPAFSADDGASGQVEIADWDAFLGSRGHEAPFDPVAIEDDLNRYSIDRLCAPWPDCSRPATGEVADRLEEAVGLRPEDVVTAAWTGPAVDAEGRVSLVVERDPADITEAVRVDPEWSSDRDSTVVEGVEVHAWLRECDVGAATFPDRPRGCGQALAVDAGIVLWSPAADGVAQMVRARRDGENLAEDPTVIGLVETLAAEQVHRARLVARPVDEADITYEVADDAVTAWQQVPAPDPYQGWGVGITDDDGVVVVVLHADEAAAKAAVDTLAQILGGMTASDGDALDRYATVGEVRAEGPAVVAELDMTPESILNSVAIPLELYLLPGE